MNNNYFSIERDKQFPCWCRACLVGKTEEQMSPNDIRYCAGCYDFLLNEARLLDAKSRRSHPEWLPKKLLVGKALSAINTPENLHPIQVGINKEKNENVHSKFKSSQYGQIGSEETKTHL